MAQPHRKLSLRRLAPQLLTRSYQAVLSGRFPQARIEHFRIRYRVNTNMAGFSADLPSSAAGNHRMGNRLRAEMNVILPSAP
jgi:hypothetical protein